MSESSHNILRSSLVDLLQSDATIASLTKGNIYPRSMAELAVDGNFENYSFPLITFRLVGSARTSSVSMPARVSLLIQCWSKSDFDQAWEVSDNLLRVMDGASISKSRDGTDIVARFRVTNKGQEAFDPTAQLFYIIQQYSAFVLSSPYA